MARGCNFFFLFLFKAFCFAFAISNSSFSQTVANDSIDRRIELIIDGSFYYSTTLDCTVEWECVDREKLRSKITFHNDQWFSFSPKKSGVYYLNVKNQECKFQRGVQVLVIDGVPCKPSAYKYLKLHSMLSLDDIYYKLEDLEGNKEYLISVDGLLGDLCQFEISVSTTPPDYAINSFPDVIRAIASREENIVRMAWLVDKQIMDSIDGFVMFRRIGNRPWGKLAEFANEKFTYNAPQNSFTQIDTLKIPEDYNYYLIGIRDGKNYLFKNFEFDNYLKIKRSNAFNYTFKSDYKGKDKINVQIFNAENDQLLKSYEVNNKTGKEYQVSLYTFHSMGIKRFKIRISYRSNPKNRKEKLFVIN